MSALVVGGVTVRVADDKEAVVEVGGELTRMFEGSLRKTLRGTKRELKIVTALMADSAATTLRTALLSTTLPVSCSGDLLRGTVSCFPELTSDDAFNMPDGIYRRFSFTLRQV